MDLTKFKFQDVSGVDMGFPTFKTNRELLAEAKERGFYSGSTPYNNLFSQLFYKGGRVKFKEGLDEEFKKKAWAYCRLFMGSWAKHEEKEAICAMLMSELVEPTLEK